MICLEQHEGPWNVDRHGDHTLVHVDPKLSTQASASRSLFTLTATVVELGHQTAVMSQALDTPHYRRADYPINIPLTKYRNGV